MAEAIGIRFDDDTLRKIDKVGKDEVLDRSSTIRKLVHLGYQNHLKEKAITQYKQEKITLSEAAKIAEVTLWEMEKLLIDNGYKSDYSIEELRLDVEKVKR
jgi:predicted HTH domain antitoxin